MTIRHPHRKIILHLAIVNGIGLILSLISFLFLDKKIYLFFSQDIGKSARPFFSAITDIGLGENYFLAILIMFLFSHFALMTKISSSQDFWKKIKTWAIRGFWALIFSGILVQLLKHLIGRKRPYKEPILDTFRFVPLNFNWEYHSFPSGHTQVIFTVAVLLTNLLPQGKWVWYFVAVLIGFSRVVVGDHFLGDVFSGACVGYSGSTLTLYWLQHKSNTRSPKDL